jgi:hypothetical protein
MQMTQVAGIYLLSQLLERSSQLYKAFADFARKENHSQQIGNNSSLSALFQWRVNAYHLITLGTYALQSTCRPFSKQLYLVQWMR